MRVRCPTRPVDVKVSVLFNEPKLLKLKGSSATPTASPCFSALQRAEIAEIRRRLLLQRAARRFSALQRAEIAEINYPNIVVIRSQKFQCSSTSRNC